MMTLAGNYQEAEPVMRETHDLAREAMGARSGAAASCVNNLAEVSVMCVCMCWGLAEHAVSVVVGSTALRQLRHV